MILKIYTDDRHDHGIDVPVNPQSTVSDILECCREPDDSQLQLVETWRNHERIVGIDERLFEILMHWGDHQNEVRFHLRQNRNVSQKHLANSNYSSSLDRALLIGKDMTYEEMQNRVSQQRQLIDRQRQMILAKEQRLRFLRQQENLRGQQTKQMPSRKYEEGLLQTKTAKGDIGGQTSVNPDFASDLETYKRAFNVTEKDLSSIIEKTNALTKHFQHFHDTRCEPSISEECQRLRSELLLRKKLNDEQNLKIASRNQTLAQRREEAAALDAKIALLQNRLRVSELQRKNEKNSRSLGANVATVEPLVPSDDRKSPKLPGPPSNVESRYQSLPPGKRLPLSTSELQTENASARLDGLAAVDKNERESASKLPSNSQSESRASITTANEYRKIDATNSKTVVFSPVNNFTSGGIPGGSASSSPHDFHRVMPSSVAGHGGVRAAVTSPTATRKTGPMFERQPATSPDIPPTRFMPPFTASVVLPPRSGQGTAPIYAVSGGGDAIELHGLSKESSAFQRSPSGRYHLNADPFHRSPDSTASRHLVGPSVKISGSIPVSTVAGGDTLDNERTNIPSQRPNDPRATNNFIPMTFVQQQSVHLDFKDQNSRNSSKRFETDAYSSMPSESHPSASGDFRSAHSDIYAQSPQPRFASMSVISDTYFRKPGSGNQDSRKAGEFAEYGSRRNQSTEGFVRNQAAGISVSRSTASPTALIRPMQNNGRVDGAPPNSANYRFHAPPRDVQITAGFNRSGSAAGSFLDSSGVNHSRGFSSRNTVTHPALISDTSSETTSSSHTGYSYHIDKSDKNILLPVRQLDPRGYDAVDHGNLPVHREGSRLSFSDERFFATDDALYKLDGYGAYYHSMRHSGDPEKSPGHQRTNAPKPLRRRLSGDSNDDSLIRPARYQQNRLVSETTLNSVQPIVSIPIPESPQSHPPDTFQTVRSFAPTIPPSDHVGTSQENQTSNVPPSGSFSTNISPSFPESTTRVLNSPVVTKPTEIPFLPAASTLTSSSPAPEESSSVSAPRISRSDSVSISGEPISESLVSPTAPGLRHSDNTSSTVALSSRDDPCVAVLPSNAMQPKSEPVEDGFAPSGTGGGGGGDAEQPLEGEPEPIALYVPESNTSKQSNLKKSGSGRRTLNRVTFDPMVLLLDACLEGELETVMKTAKLVEDPSTPNDEGITALHNAICAGHFAIVKFLVEFGCDVNAADTDGWTPLHCSASCNNLEMTRLLVENGACIFAVTTSDQETAAEKCERDEEGFETCHKYLLDMEEKLGKSSHGAVYALYDYAAQAEDELSFQCGDKITVLRKGDEVASQWWFSRLHKKEGYVPRNYLGAHPRVTPKWNSGK